MTAKAGQPAKRRACAVCGRRTASSLSICRRCWRARRRRRLVQAQLRKPAWVEKAADWLAGRERGMAGRA